MSTAQLVGYACGYPPPYVWRSQRAPENASPEGAWHRRRG